MTLTDHASLVGYRDLLLPALRTVFSYAGKTVKDCTLVVDQPSNALELIVKHEFLSAYDLERGKDYFIPKLRRLLNEALCVLVGRDAVRLQVERRALAARGEKLRKAKARKRAEP